MNLTSCPDCGSPAEIIDQFSLGSTEGPVEHLRIACVRRHWFLMPIPRPTSPADAAATWGDTQPEGEAAPSARGRGPAG